MQNSSMFNNGLRSGHASARSRQDGTDISAEMLLELNKGWDITIHFITKNDDDDCTYPDVARYITKEECIDFIDGFSEALGGARIRKTEVIL